ncbi:hypothetical protein BC831DRAFT_465211 [Entophlyctis helioformis]|nr:hypothetical protein BC831DRAFT_465211 [Entophlyctis helioformis]
MQGRTAASVVQRVGAARAGGGRLSLCSAQTHLPAHPIVPHTSFPSRSLQTSSSALAGRQHRPSEPVRQVDSHDQGDATTTSTPTSTASATSSTGTGTSSTNPAPIIDDDDGVYNIKKDPMAGMTEEQKNAIRRELREQGRRVHSIAYSIIGGSLGIVLLTVWLFRS